MREWKEGRKEESGGVGGLFFEVQTGILAPLNLVIFLIFALTMYNFHLMGVQLYSILYRIGLDLGKRM